MTTAKIAKQHVQLNVGEGRSTLICDGTEIEVSADGQSVTAYTDEGAQFSVQGGFNTVVLNGVTIERTADGHLTISAPDTVITLAGASNDSQKPLEVGDVTKDGWVYVGVDKKDQNVFAKGYGVMKWKEAMDFAVRQNAHLGSDAELALLQKNIVDKGLLKGVFATSGSTPAGWVWGARSRLQPLDPFDSARVQRLDGHQNWSGPGDGHASTVLFRSEPRP